MKLQRELQSPTGRLQQAVQFNVSNIVVMNPTAYTIGIRVGAMDVPQDMDDVDYYCPPAFVEVIPTLGKEFAFAMMDPHLATQPAGMPTKAKITFLDGSESIPSFASMPITTSSFTLPDPLPVSQSGVWNSTITNAAITVTGGVNAAITSATINVPVINGIGTDLSTSIAGETQFYSATAHAVGTYTLSNVAIPTGYRSVTLTRIHANVSRITITGATSGVVYFNDMAMQKYSKQNQFTFDFYRDIDTTVNITVTVVTATTTTPSFVLIGHRAYVPRTVDEHGFNVVVIQPPDYAIQTGIEFDDVIGPSALIEQVRYVAVTTRITRIRAVYLSMDGSTAAGQLRAIVEILDNLDLTIFRIADMRSLTTFSERYTNTNDLILPVGFKIRLQTVSTEASAVRRVTYFPYIEVETI